MSSTTHPHPRETALDNAVAILALMTGSLVFFLDAMLTHLHHHCHMNLRPYDVVESLCAALLLLVYSRILRPMHQLQSYAIQNMSARILAARTRSIRAAPSAQQQQRRRRQQQQQLLLQLPFSARGSRSMPVLRVRDSAKGVEE